MPKGAPDRESFLRTLCMPDPGLAIVRFWQGAVEIILRVICTIVAVGLLVTTALTIVELRSSSSNGNATVEKRRLNTIAATVWVLVVASVGIVVELLFIIIRFCNCEFLRAYRTPLVVDILISVGVAGGILAGSIAMAVFTHQWTEETRSENADDIRKWTAAAAGVGIGSAIFFFVMAVWSALFILNRWSKKVDKYTERL